MTLKKTAKLVLGVTKLKCFVSAQISIRSGSALSQRGKNQELSPLNPTMNSYKKTNLNNTDFYTDTHTHTPTPTHTHPHTQKRLIDNFRYFAFDFMAFKSVGILSNRSSDNPHIKKSS